MNNHSLGDSILSAETASQTVNKLPISDAHYSRYPFIDDRRSLRTRSLIDRHGTEFARGRDLGPAPAGGYSSAKVLRVLVY